MGLYDDWSTHQSITITDPAPVADFPHQLFLTWQPGMNEDFSDVRFTTTDDTNCPYWIRTDNAVAGETCEVRIKVPQANQTSILIHYGNAEATTASDGDETFLFFDDFPGSSLDTVNKWYVEYLATDYTVDGDMLTLNASGVGKGGVSSLYPVSETPIYTIGVARFGVSYFENDAVEEVVYLPGVAVYFSHISATYNGKIFGGYYEGEDHFADIVGCSPGEWQTIKCIDGPSQKIIDLDGSVVTIDVPGGRTGPYVGGRSYASGPGGDDPSSLVVFEYIYLMPYVETEPTLFLETEDTPNLVTVEYSFHTAGIVISPTQQDALVIGGSVRRSLTDKCWTCTLRYNKGETGGEGSSFFDQKVTLLVPDYNGVYQCVFVGRFPGQTANYEPANNSEEFVGYSYGMGLTQKVMADADPLLLELLSPDDQGSAHFQRLPLTALVHSFHPGKLIKGSLSGAMARVVGTPGVTLYSPDLESSYTVESTEIVVKDIVGTFVETDALTEVGGTGQASVDDVVIPLDFGPGNYYPEHWLRDLLGGTTNYATTLGLYPERLNPALGTPKPYQTWHFQADQTCQQAIDQMNTYHNFIFFDWWKYVDDEWVPVAYNVHQDDIDTETPGNHQGLDLPSEVYLVNGTDKTLEGHITMKIVGEGLINKVTIRCQDLETGIWYQNARTSGVTESAGVYAGTEIIRSYYKVDPNLVSQNDCNNAAALIYTYLSQRQATYNATFRQRTDFGFLQLLSFDGYDEIPDGEYRIIDIEHEWEAAAVSTHVTLQPVAQFRAALAVNRMYNNATMEVRRIVRSMLADTALTAPGVVTKISGARVTGTAGLGRITDGS
jgi:hypothetical protein